MTRVETDKYSVLIRSDYLYALGKLSRSREERDKLVEEAVRSFLEDYSFGERAKEIKTEMPRLLISFPVGHRPSYHMYLEFVRLSDDLVILMDVANRYPTTNTPSYDSLGTVLNTALRVYLETKHPGCLKDRIQDDVQNYAPAQ
jgi:hypothetical protein